MRFQFSTSTLLLLTAFIVISLAGAMPLVRAMTAIDWDYAPYLLVAFSPFWLPLVFLAYAIGRRTLTPRFVALFGAVEGAMGAAFYILTR